MTSTTLRRSRRISIANSPKVSAVVRFSKALGAQACRSPPEITGSIEQTSQLDGPAVLVPRAVAVDFEGVDGIAMLVEESSDRATCDRRGPMPARSQSGWFKTTRVPGCADSRSSSPEPTARPLLRVRRSPLEDLFAAPRGRLWTPRCRNPRPNGTVHSTDSGTVVCAGPRDWSAGGASMLS